MKRRRDWKHDGASRTGFLCQGNGPLDRSSMSRYDDLPGIIVVGSLANIIASRPCRTVANCLDIEPKNCSHRPLANRDCFLHCCPSDAEQPCRFAKIKCTRCAQRSVFA